MNRFRSLLALCVLAFTARLAAQSYTFSTYSTNVYAPGGVVIDSAGAVYATSYYSHAIFKLAANGVATTIAGLPGTSGAVDDSGAAARFSYPRSIALDSGGNLYVADSGNHTIRKITPSGVVTTLAGRAGSRGYANGTGAAARFDTPQGITVDGGGNVYVADTNNHALRKITPAGVVTTFAGPAPSESTSAIPGAVDGLGVNARFNAPQAVALAPSGELYVADTGNCTIRRVTAAGGVTTLAGRATSRGTADGTGAFARFAIPQALAVDGAGNIFVGDTGNLTVRRVSPAGVVTTIAGLAETSGDIAGIGSTARFYTLRSLAVDTAGSIYVADSYNIKLGTTSNQLVITVQPQGQSVAANSSYTFSVTATGGAPLSYQWQKNGTAIAGATNSSFVLPSVQAVDTGSYGVTVANPVNSVTSANASLSVLTPIANDNFADAADLGGTAGQVSGFNNGATGEPLEPTHLSAGGTASSVWYRWTPTQNGTAILNLNAQGYSAVVAIYTGNSLATLQPLMAVTSSQVGFRAAAGTTYYIAIGSYQAAYRGSFSLSWRTIANDDFANAQEISGSSGTARGSNNGATGESGEPTHVNFSGTNTSVWYRWTPSQSGTAVFTTSPGLLTVLAAYAGNSVDALTRVAQTDPNPTALNRLVFNVTAGTTYNIAVGSYGFGVGDFTLNWQTTLLPAIVLQPLGQTTTPTGSFSTLATGSTITLRVAAVSFQPPTFQWLRTGVPVAGATNDSLTLSNVQGSDSGTYTVVITNSNGSATSLPVTLTVLIPPGNDNFANATGLVGLTGSVTGTNVNATGETGEPVHWNVSGTATSVWYRWTAPTSGLAVVDTVGSLFDSVLAVYTGSSLTALTRLTQDDDRGGGRTSQVTFAAVGGTTYQIAVGGSTTSARGALKLNWQLSPVLAIATPPANQVIAAGGSATFSVQATGLDVSYQWFRNNVVIPGATNATLTIGSVQGGADASYTVAVSNGSGTVTSAPATLAVAAPSLTTLTVRNSRAGAGHLWSIAGGGGTMVAVGDGGVILSSADDGRTWVPRNSGISLWIVGVTYGAGQFVAVADQGIILTSPDGITWTPAPSTNTLQRINNVLYADGKFVAVGEGGTILTSRDARTWTPRASGVTTWLHGLAYNDSIQHFVTTGQAGVILFSADGATWTRLPIKDLTVDVEAVTAVNSYAQFVAIGHNGTAVSIHRDQLALKSGETIITWSGEISATGTSADLVGLAAGASALFATGQDGKVITATNDRGPWYTLPSGVNGILLGGLFYNDTLYIVGDNETILQSDRLFSSRLINISTRAEVGTGSNIMISGFVVTGSAPKQVLVRAAGPTLGAAPFNLPGTLAAPTLSLINSAGVTVASNTGWSTSPNASAILNASARVGAFPLGSNSADSAVLTTLPPGAYTAQVSGVGNTTGLAIVEAYDADPLSNEGSRAINISTRGQVGTGANIMIAGFVIDGASARRVLIRAAGPGLAAAPFNLSGVVAEPQIALYNSRGLQQASASAWGLQNNADEIRGAAEAVGAFTLADDSKDAAMVVTLLPGAWTVQVSGANNTTGLAIVEVYTLP